ncbi:Dehydratase OS=Streptomyces microflavus OX=1919 GN=Smic_13770 PE=3 SV=1 [Streptomyces microflavus]
MGAVPALGEHTDELLRALGMTDEQTSVLRRDGVIA